MAIASVRRALLQAGSRVRGTLLGALVVTSLWGVPALAGDTAWLRRADPVRIMAFGDSITAGVGADGADVGGGGYRGELERLLAADGYHYVMTGGRSDYSARVAMRAHEGHPGYVLRSYASAPAPQLYGAVVHKALGTYDPDIILLMAGTNDLLRLTRRVPGYTLAGVAESMNALLGQIFTEKPNVDVIVAGVVASPYISTCVVERFDGAAGSQCGGKQIENLRTLVARYAARGFHIVYASGMETAVPRDEVHFPDGIHPCGPGGYAAVARVWLRAIEDETAAPNQSVARSLP